MEEKTVGIVCGTRPEIIKLAPVYHALRNESGLRVVWVHTGQHGDMAADMLRCFDIVPDVQLERSGTTLEQFMALYETPVNADGTSTGNAPINNWPEIV